MNDIAIFLLFVSNLYLLLHTLVTLKSLNLIVLLDTLILLYLALGGHI